MVWNLMVDPASFEQTRPAAKNMLLGNQIHKVSEKYLSFQGYTVKTVVL